MEKARTIFILSFLLFSLFVVYSTFNYAASEEKNEINIMFYYGQGCPHCKMTEKAFEELGDENIKITKKEIYFNDENREEFMELMDEYNVPMNARGVPALLWNGKLITIGELNKNQVVRIAEEVRECGTNCTKRVESTSKISGMETITSERDKLTLLAVISAALVDSVNPCTLAVMAMLLTTIVMQRGKKHALWAGIIFTTIIFIMYSLIGLGIIKVVVFSSFEKIFFYAMMLFAFIMAIMEFRAYFDYKPGFISMEMPMWLRPYAKKCLKAATSLYAVAIAALGCSLFLLPCSSGPYLVILSLLAKTKSAVYISYLILYNLIFVLPMIAITLIIYLGLSTAEKVSEFRNRYIKHLHLISGVLMLIVIAIIWAYII